MKHLLISATAAALLSTSLCAADLTYSTHGGFIENTVQAGNFTNYTPGLDDTTQDGPWFREGPFSEPVLYGDVANNNKRDPQDPNGAWPALTWGHEEQAPWISEGGAGDNLGGASGIGSIGYKNASITVDDAVTFYPVMAIQHQNQTNSYLGTLAVDISWNIDFFDTDNNLLLSKNFVWNVSQWETLNYIDYCPRTLTAAGASVNDTQFNLAGLAVITFWPQYGLDQNYTSDGVVDVLATACSDAIGLNSVLTSETFTDGTPGYTDGQTHVPATDVTTEYTVTFSGFYTYLPEGERPASCPALGSDGMPDTSASKECFRLSPTIWSAEKSATAGFVAMSITSKAVESDVDPDMGDGCHGSKNHGSHGSKGSKGNKGSKNHGSHGSKNDKSKKDDSHGSKGKSKDDSHGSKNDKSKKDDSHGSKGKSKDDSHGSKKSGKGCK